MANERITEDMVDNLLRELDFYSQPDEVTVEKQHDEAEEIIDLDVE